MVAQGCGAGGCKCKKDVAEVGVLISNSFDGLKNTLPIVYRYLASHWYESLRDACFLASPPNKFNDSFDCAAEAVGAMPEDVVKHYFDERDWFTVFMKVAQQKGFSIETVTQALNSPKFNIDTLDIDRRIRSLLSSRVSISEVYRIVCFSALPNDSIEKNATERRMWKRYAGKDKGVRIGVDFSYCTEATDCEVIRPVFYSDEPVKVDFSRFRTTMVPSEEICRIVFTKDKKIWGRECEVRLITSRRFCTIKKDKQNGHELCFWKFNREMVRQIFLGARYPQNQFNGLKKMLDKFYPWIEVYSTSLLQQEQRYQYKRIL